MLASSSSVYGVNSKVPFSESDPIFQAISPYAASKLACEALGHVYHHTHGLDVIMLRFFTVYGPWGRPDMALFKFTRGILRGEAIDVYNHGNMERDFTYIDDIVKNVISIGTLPPNSDTNESSVSNNAAPYRIYNIGNNAPVKLMKFVKAIEEATEKKAIINFMEMQPGDVQSTYADSTALVQRTGIAPSTSIRDGVASFVTWYRRYYDE